MVLDLVTARAQISEIYIAAFNRVPDTAGLTYWVDVYSKGATLAAISQGFTDSAEYKAKYPQALMTNAEYVDKIYQNVFNRAADTAGKNFWVGKLTDGSLTWGTLIEAMRTAAHDNGSADGVRLTNLGDYGVFCAINSIDPTTAAPAVATITADPATLEAAKSGETGGGQTYNLKTTQDIIAGTAGNDVVNGLIDLADAAAPAPNANTTFNGFDQINGAGGTNTFKLAVSGGGTANIAADYAVSLSNIEKMQVVEINNTAEMNGNAVTVDASNNADVTDLKVTKSTSEIKLTGSATANVNVTGATDKVTIKGGASQTISSAVAKDIVLGGAGATDNTTGAISVTNTKQGAGTIDVDGGSTVTVTATSTVTNGTIKVGANKAASGAVSVTSNLNGDGTASIDQADITIKGGSTVTVNSNMTITAKNETAGAAHTLGDVAVVGDSKTTSVTINQTYAETEFTKTGSAVVKEIDTVTFKAMTKGQTLIASDGANAFTFTASKNLTAAEVAAAFSNLIKADTQSAGGPTANGYYTNDFSKAANALWTTGAASGDTVVFTAADENETNITWGGSATAPTVVNTAGKAKVNDTTSSNTVTYGKVAVDDNATAAITTVTLNGFTDAALGTTSGALGKIATLNLANSAGDTVLKTSSTTLGLTLNKITKAVDLDNATANQAITDLTVTTTGTASALKLTAAAVKNLIIDAGVALDVKNAGTQTIGTGNALQTVTVKGAGAVDLGTVASTGLKTFDASANAGGVTAKISAKTADVAATFTEYLFSKGADVVTLSDATVNKNISLGAGNDKITLAASTTTLAATIDGGEGSNTLVMNSADAATASLGTTFEAKIDKFDKLSLNAVLTTAQNKVNLDNLDDIKYVISAGTVDTKAKADVTVTVTTQLDGGNTDTASITLNGVTVTTAALTASGVDAASDAGVIATALDTAIGADGTLNALYDATVAGGVLTITSKADGKPVIIGAVSVAGTGVASSANAVKSSELTLDKMLDGGTLELTGAGTGAVVIMKDATGTADSFNIVTGAGANVGTVAVDSVETINFTTTKAKSDIVYLAANKAETVTVKGEGNLDLTLASTTTATKLVDANTMSGVLTFTAGLNDLVVKGGSGKDVLTANANDVTLYGGASDDTLTVTSGLRVNLYGDAGKDTFVIGAGASNTLDAYTVINGVDSGDVIKLTNATAFSSTKIALSVGADETLLNYANQAIKTIGLNELGWFQKGGNTYIVQDGHNNTDAFDTASDMIIMLVGLVDLGTGASYNSTSNILEIV